MLVKRYAEALPPGREPQLKRRQTETSNCCVNYGTYHILASCYGDKGVRKQMEDEHLMVPSLLAYQPSLTLCDFAVFGVFDGHGGRQAALFVKEVLPAELAAQLLLLQKQKQQQQQEQQQQHHHHQEGAGAAGAAAGSIGEKSEHHSDSSSSSSGANSSSSSCKGDIYMMNGDTTSTPTTPSTANTTTVAGIFSSTHGEEEHGDQTGKKPPQDLDNGGLTDREMKQVLFAAFKKVDARIATEIPACRDGCTAVVVLMRERQVYIACLGDSAAYLARKRDATLHCIPLTEVHRHWVIEEKERIARMGGTIENGRVNGALEVTRSFGDISLKRYGVSCIPTVRKFVLDPTQDQFLLLGCDGFWNCWTARDAVTFAAELWDKEVRSSKVHSRPVDPQNVCKQLVEHVLIDKKSQDNITLMMLRVMPDTPSYQ